MTHADIINAAALIRRAYDDAEAQLHQAEIHLGQAKAALKLLQAQCPHDEARIEVDIYVCRKCRKRGIQI